MTPSTALLCLYQYYSKWWVYIACICKSLRHPPTLELLQAKTLVWADLSAEQLESIRHPHPKKGLNGRDLLAKYLGLAPPHQPQQEFSLDLYVHTLQLAQVGRVEGVST